MHGKGCSGVTIHLHVLPLKSANINLPTLRLNICMNIHLERYLILLLILTLIGLSGCVSQPKSIESKEQKVPTTLETIGKLDAIGTVLGCLFDPRPCQKASKKLEKELEDGNTE